MLQFLFRSPAPVGESLAWDGTCFVRYDSLWIAWKMYLGLRKNYINKACFTVSKLTHTLMRGLSKDIEIWSKHKKVQTNAYLLKSFSLFSKRADIYNHGDETWRTIISIVIPCAVCSDYHLVHFHINIPPDWHPTEKYMVYLLTDAVCPSVTFTCEVTRIQVFSWNLTQIKKISIYLF